jgi:hypothetical protein
MVRPLAKLVYLIEQPLDVRNFERFGIELWLERGWSVEVWDMTYYVAPHIRSVTTPPVRVFPGYFAITTKAELEARAAAVGAVDFFVDFAGVDSRALDAKLRLVRLGATRITLNVGSLPEPGVGLATKIWEAIRGGPVGLVRCVSAKVARMRLAGALEPGLIVVSGDKAARVAEHHVGPGRIVRAHNLDYDILLRRREERVEASDGHVVFLDQDLCFHYDFVFEEETPYATPDRYFPSVCRVLRRLEERLGVSAVVAAHPRSAYRERDGNPFQGIPVEYERAFELIRGARAVVVHNSTAIQFAVMFQKPLVFLTTDELERSVGAEYIAVFAKSLGKSVINADGDLDRVDWDDVLQGNPSLYAQYSSEYIKSHGSPERPLWEIVARRLEADLSAPGSVSTTAYPQRAPAQRRR